MESRQDWVQFISKGLLSSVESVKPSGIQVKQLLLRRLGAIRDNFPQYGNPL
jgi:hypothetical protein